MAARVALVTDGTSDLPDATAQDRQITIVPQHIIWGRDDLRDRVDIDIDQFYERLIADPETPKTSQPSPGEFAEVFQRTRDATDAEAIIAPLISSELSGTYSSAQQAAKMVDFPVHAVDTRTASIGLGLTVLAAADARDEGADAEEIVALVRQVAARTQVIFAVDTLEYFYRGGRVSNLQRLLGTILQIKPVLWVQDGRIEPFESIRTRKRALERLVTILDEMVDRAKPLRIGVLHGHAHAEVQMLAARIQERFQPEYLMVGSICPPIGVHTGPGVIGYGFLQ